MKSGFSEDNLGIPGYSEVLLLLLLYCGSDLRVFICSFHLPECAGTVDLNDEFGCLISEGQWLFAGLPNAIKGWGFQAQIELYLSGPIGQVYSMVVDNDMLFAGAEVWTATESGNLEVVYELKEECAK
ncbi:Hypothetical predicted protein [Olea europaea subsp. europaea]|uniref:Uncharacterized protein n=1 Tax=Olea europaea subsp. europaea TaxID=158383 RepID=A0A8S0TRK0_OLEEU|nr:Hypothetical predicted protein [Olea europaea subsp. europaea]